MTTKRETAPSGRALTLRGGANMGRFIDADKKIELVNELFPGGTDV